MYIKSVLLVIFLVVNGESNKIIRKSAFTSFTPCSDPSIVILYQYGSYPMGEENQYILVHNINYPEGVTITVVLDSSAIIEVFKESETFVEVFPSEQKNTFVINYIAPGSELYLIVKGFVYGKVPYIKSFIIGGLEYCPQPMVGYLDNVVKNQRIARQVLSSLPNGDCGRRKLDINELIINGESTEPGEWPWHTAIYMHEGASNWYICGGTLISKLFVLTAAHCVTINKVPVIPDILSVVVGKYNLIESDIASQQKEVFEVIIHEDFGKSNNLANDIALLKLKSEVVYSNYVQPACLWSSNDPKLPTNQTMGTVVGWGVQENYELSSKLKQVSMPMVSETTCINRNPMFYRKMLSSGKAFCAGWTNGTSPCSGDSGGGFFIYKPDNTTNISGPTGTWFIRGIVSNIKTGSKNTCDPEHYVVFTDTSKYEIWIRAITGINESSK